MKSVRPPAVAGSFYPGNQTELISTVDSLIKHSQCQFNYSAKAFIVPHAGYQYSGSTAAEVYALLAKQKSSIKRVVLLGPCHRVWIQGMAIPSCDSFATPLGDIPLDVESLAEITRMPQIQVSDVAHQDEHSLEVQLPFLQRSLDDFMLVPIAVGEASVEEVSLVIDYFWEMDDTVFLISSDLSHFLSYDLARQVDEKTTQIILAKDFQNLDHKMACGCTPIQGILEVAQEKNLQVSLLKQCNSGDTAGDKSRVVGYAAYALY